MWLFTAKEKGIGELLTSIEEQTGSYDALEGQRTQDGSREEGQAP